VYRWAIREGYAEANPLARIPKYSERGRARETYLTDDEARALVAAADKDFRPFLVCALATGMRLGELLTLTWGSVDLANRQLTVEPEKTKTSRSRTISLSAWLEEHLRQLLGSDGKADPTARVFRTPADEAYTHWQVRKRLDAAIDGCTVIPPEKKPKVSMHVMRHTAASLMVAAGVPIFDVAKILGHSTIAVTMRYAHFAPAAGRSAIDALDRRLRPTEDPPRVSEGGVGYRVDSRQPRANIRATG
jgi:integrase